MSAYIVSYDLRKQRDYESLYEALKSYWTYAKVLESLWVVVSWKTAIEIRNHLSWYVDEDDWLIVIKSGREWAWKKVNCSDKWLQDYL